MAWTTPRTWSDGELVTAAIMNPHVRDNLSVVVRNIPKTADETVTSSTALQDDNHLFFAMATNEYYSVQGGLWASNANSGVDIKIAFTVPASATYHIVSWGFDASGTFSYGNHRSAADSRTFDAESTGFFICFSGSVVCAGTAGNLQLQWAQAVSNASGTVLKKGSWLNISKLG